MFWITLALGSSCSKNVFVLPSRRLWILHQHEGANLNDFEWCVCAHSTGVQLGAMAMDGTWDCDRPSVYSQDRGSGVCVDPGQAVPINAVWASARVLARVLLLWCAIWPYVVLEYLKDVKTNHKVEQKSRKDRWGLVFFNCLARISMRGPRRIMHSCTLKCQSGSVIANCVAHWVYRRVWFLYTWKEHFLLDGDQGYQRLADTCIM